MTSVTCPRCGAENDPQNPICLFCNQPLHPVPGSVTQAGVPSDSAADVTHPGIGKRPGPSVDDLARHYLEPDLDPNPVMRHRSGEWERPLGLALFALAAILATYVLIALFRPQAAAVAGPSMGSNAGAQVASGAQNRPMTVGPGFLQATAAADGAVLYFQNVGGPVGSVSCSPQSPTVSLPAGKYLVWVKGPDGQTLVQPRTMTIVPGHSTNLDVGS